ncbi:hypothetical protein ACFY1J_11010 [Streptomyces sp. NPDC001406]|uniref:hypothetical protein n=1 Tax=Streptomyces sp. NPDC001406 TaxID=3364572 RepID=UPI0036B687A1
MTDQCRPAQNSSSPGSLDLLFPVRFHVVRGSGQAFREQPSARVRAGAFSQGRLLPT